MQELINDSFYETLSAYDRLEIDYCLMADDSLFGGYEAHKKAILYAMNRLRECYPWITVDPDRASAEEIDAERLFFFPDQPEKDSARGKTADSGDSSVGGTIPYWYAFSEPPHGTGPVIRNGKKLRNRYSREDFEIINSALFPKGMDELEIYEWSEDWSSYFEAGREWWGTICCSIYDKKLQRYAVIMASSTD